MRTREKCLVATFFSHSPARWALAGAASVAVALAGCGGGGGGADAQAWGEAKLGFTGAGTDTAPDVQGQGFGTDRVRLVMQGNGSDVKGLVAELQSELAKRQAVAPGVAFGIVPQRVPSVVYHEGRSSDPGFAVLDIDPVTGAPRLAALRYNDDMTPYNADATVAAQRLNVVPRMLAAALDREAIAPIWEVQTARQQQDRADTQAGLAEVLRAAAQGQLAAPVPGSTTQRDPGHFMPLALDLDGDGVISTVPDSASTRAINWDGSGYLKQVGWVGAGDGLLFLDRNGDGQPDHGRELFSNSLLADAAKGATSLAWLDANGDGRITSADPALTALRVWRDANGNAVVDSGEAISLPDLGITELDYRAKTFVRNGKTTLMDSPVLEASAKGYRLTVDALGITVACSDGTGTYMAGVTRADQLNLETLCR